MAKEFSVHKINRKLVEGGTILLSSVLFVSLGFSMWSISTADKAQSELAAYAEDLLDVKEVFQLQEPSMFSFSEYGIIRDETICSDGEIYFPILIKTTSASYSKIKKNDDGSLPFVVTIEDTGTFNIFDSTYLSKDSNGKVSGNYSANNTEYSKTCDNSFSAVIDSKVITSTFSIANDNSLLNQDVYFMMAFNFKFDNYSTTTYQSLSSSSFSFSVSVKAQVL